MRPLFFAAALPMNVEWKMRPYFGVLLRVFNALRYNKHITTDTNSENIYRRESYSEGESDQSKAQSWIGLCSVLRPRQQSIGYMGNGFYRSKDPTKSIKVVKEKATKENPENTNNRKYTYT